jgi:DNA-binding MarR family transcriptional regulator
MPSRLQAEIKQSKPFASLEHEAILGLLRTAAIVDHATDEALRPFGLTGTQFNVLRILRGAGADGLCGREIGERMINRVPDVPRLLDRLDKAELISRERDPNDRRHVTARITDKGKKLVDEIGHASSPVEQWFKKLTREQLETMIAALDAIREG